MKRLVKIRVSDDRLIELSGPDRSLEHTDHDQGIVQGMLSKQATPRGSPEISILAVHTAKLCCRASLIGHDWVIDLIGKARASDHVLGAAVKGASQARLVLI